MFVFQASIQGKSDSGPGPLSATFDQVLAALDHLDRLFIEPDGSFVWTGSLSSGESWQVDGNLIDQGDCLAYVELKGRCPESQLNQILGTLGWPEVPLVFELTRRGIVVAEDEFRRLAATQAGAV